jgi:formylglycine-generating enzyme required for sulfatase activity
MKKCLLCLLVVLLSSTPIFANRGLDVTSQSNRIALVIGNGSYSIGPLKNPVNDAKGMSTVLKDRGFSVLLLTNANQRQMEKAIGRFGKQLRDGGVGLFFYAGHGMQVDGVNYLIPIGANIEAEEDIKFESVNANRILAKMLAAGNGLNMVFLDACRNNPFARSFRSSSNGLATMDAPSGSLLAFATAPGKTAADGAGKNGLFTGHLIRQMKNPDLSLTKLMMEVRKGVLRDSENKQTPWDVSSLTGDFYFHDKEGRVIPQKEITVSKPSIAPDTVASVLESEMWDMVKDSRNVTDLEVFIESFPNGAYRSKADSKLWLLSAHSLKSIKSYLIKYPDSPFRKVADKRIWDLYNEKNSLEQYQQFINEFPKNQYVGFAKLKISKINQEVRTWEEAKRIGNKEAIQDYLNKYPEGRFVTLANRYLTIQPGMVVILDGEFEMGSNSGDSDEKPVHQVNLDGFYIDKLEVTVGKYEKCYNAGTCKKPKTGSYYNWGKSGRKNHPINGVSWHDAQAYCEYAGKRLPTEAEWEKAATWKDGRKYKYPSGKNSVSCADAVMSEGGGGCGKDRTWSVRSKPEEINGTYDMAGNVWEWVADWHGDYSSGYQKNPSGPSSGSGLVIRGGSWDDAASYLRGAYRFNRALSGRYGNVGFRCARSPK